MLMLDSCQIISSIIFLEFLTLNFMCMYFLETGSGVPKIGVIHTFRKIVLLASGLK